MLPVPYKFLVILVLEFGNLIWALIMGHSLHSHQMNKAFLGQKLFNTLLSLLVPIVIIPL